MAGTLCHCSRHTSPDSTWRLTAATLFLSQGSTIKLIQPYLNQTSCHCMLQGCWPVFVCVYSTPHHLGSGEFKLCMRWFFNLPKKKIILEWTMNHAYTSHFSPRHINIPREMWMLLEAVKLTEIHQQREFVQGNASAGIMVLSDGKEKFYLQQNFIFVWSQK